MNIILICIIILCFKFFLINSKIEKFTIIDEKQRIYTLILFKTNQIFNKLNIPYFISSGTCLGYYREKQFIEYDYDIDIGIFKEDYSNNIMIKFSFMNWVNYYTSNIYVRLFGCANFVVLSFEKR